MIRHNRAVLISAIRGDFALQEQALRKNLVYDQGNDAQNQHTHTAFCILHESLGDWNALAEDLQQIKQIRLQLESGTADHQVAYQLRPQWEMFHWATFYIGTGDFLAAQPLIKDFTTSVDDADAIASAQWLQAWGLRCQRKFAECITYVDTIPPDPREAARFYRAATVFERAAATLFAGHSDWDAGIEAHLRFHMQIGSKHYLLRRRILFALACTTERRWTMDDRRQPTVHRPPSFHKHITFVLCSLKRYGYQRLLIQREPELAAHFWRLCLVENIQPETALAALAEIGRSDLLFEVLTHASSAVRGRAVAVIAAIGDEATIPRLAQALTQETDSSVRAQIERTLDHLEALPPPTLRVTLLGEFAVQRGKKTISADDWQRPGARRLFQYFVLNQGQPLQRERILEDLWPTSDPTAARGSFKSVYSLLRIAIEPYLRPKSTSRYLKVEQETYTLNPQHSAAILNSDISEFVRVVRAVLREADMHAVRPMPASFIAALEAWKPLVSELNYEVWAVETRERLQNLYVEGCLYAGDAMLDIDKPIEAALWAERVLAIAPWSEEAWEQLMRAQARQGNRTIALKSYAAAVAVLKRELDAPPSAKLTWLAKRLRQDEEI